MRRLKVLKVVDAWKWFAEAEQMYQASLALVRRGHRVEIACQPESPAAERAREVGLEVHALPGLRSPRWPGTPLANAARLARIVERVRPDVLHAYRSPPHVLSAAALKLVRGERPALVRTRAGAQRIRRGPLNRALYDRWTAATLVTSERIREDMVRGGFDAARIVAVPSVVDPAPLANPDPAAFRRDLGLAADAPVVGVVGRLARIKGHRHLLEAMPTLLARYPALEVCFVGPEADLSRGELETGARRLGVAERLHVTGARDDVASALAAFDVVAICSVGSEVISRVLLEAMALGRPVVATTVGVIPEIVRDGREARLVPPGEAAALGEAILSILGDPEAARAMGRAGAEAVRAGHLPEHLADVLEAVYARAAAPRTDPGPA